jgi:hypothetical protein
MMETMSFLMNFGVFVRRFDEVDGSADGRTLAFAMLSEFSSVGGNGDFWLRPAFRRTVSTSFFFPPVAVSHLCT